MTCECVGMPVKSKNWLVTVETRIWRAETCRWKHLAADAASAERHCAGTLGLVVFTVCSEQSQMLLNCLELPMFNPLTYPLKDHGCHILLYGVNIYIFNDMFGIDQIPLYLVVFVAFRLKCSLASESRWRMSPCAAPQQLQQCIDCANSLTLSLKRFVRRGLLSKIEAHFLHTVVHFSNYSIHFNTTFCSTKLYFGARIEYDWAFHYQAPQELDSRLCSTTEGWDCTWEMIFPITAVLRIILQLRTQATPTLWLGNVDDYVPRKSLESLLATLGGRVMWEETSLGRPGSIRPAVLFGRSVSCRLCSLTVLLCKGSAKFCMACGICLLAPVPLPLLQRRVIEYSSWLFACSWIASKDDLNQLISSPFSLHGILQWR